MKNPPYTMNKLATAFLHAEAVGVIRTHAVVVNIAHLVELLQEGKLDYSGSIITKKTTGRPVWVFTIVTGEESVDKLSKVLGEPVWTITVDNSNASEILGA